MIHQRLNDVLFFAVCAAILIVASCQGQVVRAEAAAPNLPLEAAIVQVESGGDNDAVGDHGLAVGIFQIQPIMVKEVNRILGRERFTMDDRRDRDKSLEMFRIFSGHWASHYKDNSMEGIARRWNGGPRGHLKAATVPYWKKVKTALDGLDNQ